MSHFDLHCHTSCSDGKLTPLELIALAKENNITDLAITDHDTVAAHRILKNEVDLGLNLITGIELSCQWSKIGIHIVGLNIDIDSPAILTAEAQLNKVRQQRLERIAYKLEKRGFDGILAGAQAEAGDNQVGRPHIARFMVKAGMVRSVSAAFDKYLGAGKVGDVSSLWPALEQVVEWINAAGGVAVVAHPGRYNMTRSKRIRMIEAFQQAGGQALEVCTGNQPHGMSEDLANICEKYELMASVGSDFHSPSYPWVKLGRYPRLPKRCKPVWDVFARP